MNSKLDELKDEVKEVKSEVKEVKSEVKEVKSEVKEVKSDVKKLLREGQEQGKNVAGSLPGKSNSFLAFID